MKSYQFYKNFNFIIFFILFILKTNLLNANDEIEKNFKDLTQNLRCMTCQNQSIYDSDAEFSINIKKIIRQKLIKGKSKKEINNFLEKRYGEYILFEPKFNKKNLLLWIFPFFILIISAIFLIRRISKNKLVR